MEQPATGKPQLSPRFRVTYDRCLEQAPRHQEARRSWEKWDLTGISRGQGKCVISNTSSYWGFVCFRWRLHPRRKLVSPSELAAAMVTLLYAPMATTGMPRMPAHPTATTART